MTWNVVIAVFYRWYPCDIISLVIKSHTNLVLGGSLLLVVKLSRWLNINLKCEGDFRIQLVWKVLIVSYTRLAYSAFQSQYASFSLLHIQCFYVNRECFKGFS